MTTEKRAERTKLDFRRPIFHLRAKSSTYVLVLLLNQPVITLEQIKLAWEIHRSEDGSQTLVDTVRVVLSLTWHKTFSFYLLPAWGFSGIMIYNIANKVYVLWDVSH